MSPPGRPKGEYRRAQPEGPPVSALGNLLVAARAIGHIDGGLDQLRMIAAASSDLTHYQPTNSPNNTSTWHDAAQRLNSLTNQKG